MAGILNIKHDRLDTIVSEAIRNESPVVLTVRQGRGWSTVKAGFVSPPVTGSHIVVGASVLESASAVPLLQPGEQVGVAFRRGHKKCMFATTVQAPVAPRETATDRVLTLGWPETLQELQRRVYHRAAPPAGSVVSVDVWPGHADQPEPPLPTDPARLSGTLQDLSVGGVRIAVNENADLEEGSPAVCGFAPRAGAPPFVVNAVFRHLEPGNGRFSYGFQFVGLEVRSDGPHILSRLARLVTEYQRASTRPKTGHRPRGA